MSEIELKKVQVNTSDTTVSTSKPAESGSSTKPTIFAAGLTKADAETNGLMDLFTKYNKDGDEVISEEEFKQYTTDQQTVTGNSGKRTAAGGIYTVQKGDSLSLIANDFGIDLMTLYEINKETIGKNMNRIEIGQQIKISGAKVNTNQNTANTNSTEDKSAKIFIGMTRAQAEEIGGETLEVFNQFAAGADEISAKQFGLYKKLTVDAADPAMIEQLKTTDLHSPEGIALIQKMIKSNADMELVDKDYQNKDIRSAIIEFGITPEMLEEAGLSEEEIRKNPEKFGKFLYDALQKKYEAEANNPESESYKTNYERLKRGEYTQFEREKLGLKGELTEEQLKFFTQTAIKNKYIATIASIQVNSDNKEEAQYLAGMTQGLSHAFLDDHEKLKGALVVQGLLKLEGTEYAGKTADMVATNAQAYGIFTGDEESDVLATKAILPNASPESIETMIENNPDKVDFIKDILEYVVADMPDGAAKTALINAVNKAAASVETSQGSNSNKSSAASVNNNNNNTAYNNVNYNTNPLSPTNRTITEGKTYYPDDNTYANVSSEVKTATNGIRNEMSVPEQIRYAKAKIQGMPKEKLLSLIAENYALIPDKYKPHIINYFGQMPMNTRFDMYLRGSDELRKFMDEQAFMQQGPLMSYLKGHPAELKVAPESVQEMYKEYQEETATT